MQVEYRKDKDNDKERGRDETDGIGPTGSSDTLTVWLKKGIEDNTGNIVYDKLTLEEPALMQVEQFYDMQRKENALVAMRLLISLVSGVPESIIRRMKYTDFRRCEEFMTDFLTWKPSGGGGN